MLTNRFFLTVDQTKSVSDAITNATQ